MSKQEIVLNGDEGFNQIICPDLQPTRPSNSGSAAVWVGFSLFILV